MQKLKKRRINGQKSSKWYGVYRDESGKEKWKALSTDKRVASQMLAQIVRDAERRKAGLIDDFQENSFKPISDHLIDYRKELESRGNTEHHVQNTITCCERVIDGCGLSRITDLFETSVRLWLKKERDNGLSVRSSNRHSTAIKSFARWLWLNRRTPSHLLVGLSNLNERVDRRHERRSLSDDDFARFLETTRKSERIDKGSGWKFTGEDRYLLYVLASMTGLRASELASLRVGNFDLTEKTLSVEALNTKNRQEAHLPLHSDVIRFVQGQRAL